MSGKKNATEPSAGQPWLDALEARVRDAVERLTALGSENRRLAERVAELEARLAEAAAAGDDAAAPEAEGVEPAAWRRERDEVRRRVERLTETLESLLADDDG
jgi:cell division septum initiation protein DivIVA